jgi:hypothetical protein
MEGILIELIKSGATAFIGTKVTKALSQKEISETIAACGWLVVGYEVVRLLVPIVNGIHGFFNGASSLFDKADSIVDKLGKLRFIGDFFENGRDKLTPH